MTSPSYLRVVVLALVTAGQLADARPVAACSCVGTPAELAADARQIYLARARREVRVGEGYERSFDVLHVLKGEPTRKFVWSRTDRKGSCTPSFETGEVTFLLVRDGSLELCDGNFGLRAQMSLPGFVLAIGGQSSAPSHSAVRAGLTGALRRHVHRRRELSVAYPPLVGERVRVGRSALRFVDASPGAVVQVTEARRYGPLTYLAGTHDGEWFTFHVLVLERSTKRAELLAVVSVPH